MAAVQAVVSGQARVGSAHLGVFGAFVTAGVAFSALASRLPDLRDLLQLDPSELGLLLLAMAAGAVTSLPTAGWLAGRIGAGRAVLAGAGLVATGLLVAGVGSALTSVSVVAAGLLLAGLGTGTWDVAMNLHGAEVERRLRRTVMPRYHAAFSLGAVGAAGVGALATWARVPVLVHFGLTAAITLTAATLATRRFLPTATATAEPATSRRNPLAAWLEPRTLLIGVVVLAAAFTEGAANDWLAVGITDGYRAPAWVGVLGFGALVAAMTVGRALGPQWLDRYGRVPVVWCSFALAMLGSLLVIFGPALGLYAAFGGALLWGLGAALGFPVGISAAADDPRHAPARLSVVASIGYLAFLAGPPVLGFLGDRVGVLHALLAVTALCIPALLAVPATRPLQVSE